MSICNAEDIGIAYSFYRASLPLLKEYMFVLSAQTGIYLGPASNRTFSAGASIRGLFRTERVLVLDAETVADRESGGATIPIDCSVFLDTIAVSHLEPYLNGGRVPLGFKEVFDFIARDDVDVNLIPHVLENLF